MQISKAVIHISLEPWLKNPPPPPPKKKNPRDWDLKPGDLENMSNKTKKAGYSNCHGILYPICSLCCTALLLFWQ